MTIEKNSRIEHFRAKNRINTPILKEEKEEKRSRRNSYRLETDEFFDESTGFYDSKTSSFSTKSYRKNQLR